jgi:hypothetical protein
MSKKDFENLIIVLKAMNTDNEVIIEMFKRLKTFYPKIDISIVEKYLNK